MPTLVPTVISTIPSSLFLAFLASMKLIQNSKPVTADAIVTSVESEKPMERDISKERMCVKHKATLLTSAKPVSDVTAASMRNSWLLYSFAFCMGVRFWEGILKDVFAARGVLGLRLRYTAAIPTIKVKSPRIWNEVRT